VAFELIIPFTFGSGVSCSNSLKQEARKPGRDFAAWTAGRRTDKEFRSQEAMSGIQIRRGI
jgi:hypothetical protein